MATEMSCLAGVDGDEKDVDPEINALTLLQEPLRMAGILESTSCNDSLNKPSLKHSSVQDALSNTDMLSPVGLGNVPSSQATPAYEVNSSSMEKEEEKSITPLKTVQEIDTAGIWGFDEESPENSSDNFSSSELHWNAHKEFMQFLWEDPNDSPDAEPKEEVHPPNSQRRRKRKMDMVVMVDPSEDLYPDRTRKSSEEASDADSQVDSIPFTKVRKSRKFPKSQSLPAETNHPNGTVKGIKHIHYNASTRNSHDTSPGCELSPLRGRLTVNSHSEEKKSGYPCSKCKLIFKKDHHLQAHMKTHRDPPTISPKPFICRECGHCFRESSLLIEHMTVYHKKRARLTGEVKGKTDKKNVDKNAKLFCPQCPFGTNCPNTFVQHAKTHEKDKRTVKRCDKCSFMTLSQNELRRHNIKQHTVITVRKSIHNHDSGIYSCSICSYKAFSKNIFRNHLMRRHQQSLEEYEAAQSDKDAQPCTEQHVTTCNTPVADAEFTSKILIKNQITPRRAQSPNKSNNISDLFENSRIRRGLKSHLTESKLDKSINVLLSRQRHGRKASEQKEESSGCSTSVQGSRSDNGSSDLLRRTLSVEVDSTALPPNGCSLSPGAAERDPNSDSGPKSNIEQSPLKKSPSKRKMSTPYRNTSDQDSCFILPKPLPSPKQQNQLDEDCEEKGIFQGKDADVDSIFDNGIKREKQNIIYTYTRRMSMRGALQASKRLFEKIKTEDPDSNDPEIKEECVETEVYQEPMDTHPVPLRESFTDDVTESESERKNCPYCPAVFESGVGLSNHVRGHLHRAGLSYNERHVVSPEQVACQDKRPRVRRRMSAFRRLKKAFRLEADSETVKSIHSCPLCGDSFDNRTGQSNHIRGHLKKLGKSFATKNKSPLFLLWELMRDKKEFQRALQILGKTQNHYQFDSSAKLEQFSNEMSPSPIEIPLNHSVSSVCTDAKPLMSTFSFAEMESEKRHLETKLDVKDSLSGSNALIGILKKRRCQEDSRLKGSSPMLRNNQVIPSNSEQSSGSRIASSLPNSISEKGEFNRKVCVHCNATFHSGVSLSNHLRAYAKRKRTALLEGTAIDCKARRQRLRHSSKKKTLPLPQTPEEMYRLTCRFCDLVFQGPLSVQEDWIKHLQRHIMNTSVPHTGLGMVEVTSLPSDPPTLKTDEDSFPTAANDAS